MSAEPARIRRNRIKAEILECLASQVVNFDEPSGSEADWEFVVDKLTDQLHNWAVRIQPSAPREEGKQ